MLVAVGCLHIVVGFFQLFLLQTVVILLVYVCGGLFMIGVAWANWYALANAYTELTERGLVVRAYRTRLVEWGAITDVQPIRSGRFWRVRVRRAAGRDVTLLAPLTHAKRPDQRFATELDAIRAFWWPRRAGTGNAPGPQWHR